jgi:uncharacterized RDD family membrane protein YckC
MSSDQPSPYPPAQPPPGYPPAAGYPGYPPSGAGAAYPAYPSAPPPQQWAQSGPPLASWGDRVLAAVIDGLYQLPAAVLYFLGFAMMAVNAPTTTRSGTVVTRGNPGLMWLGVALLVLGILGMIGIGLYNLLALQGKTGQTWGKRRIGIKVIHQETGAILSVGQTFLRQLCHYLDGAVFDIGYLWPLWDPMRQTFADKLMKTVVVKIR